MTYVIDSTNLDRLASPHHSAPIADVLAWPLREVATADINQATFTYPLGQVSVDNTSAGWSDIRIGQLVRITTSLGLLVTTGIVRKAPTSNILYISAIGRGDPGAAQMIGRELVDNLDVTIYDYLPIWTLHSRIKSGIFYKRFDTAYTDEGTNPVPVCNIGTWRHARAVGGVAQFAFSASGSFAWNAKTITGYSWAMPSGGTLISGSLTGADCTIELPPGFHLIHCTVTDSGGKTRTATRPIWVTEADTSSDAPLSYQRAIKHSSDRQTLQGRGMALEVWGSSNILRSTIYDGGAVLVVDSATHGGESLDTGVYVDQYVGFISGLTSRGDVSKTIATFETKGLGGTLNDVPNAPQAIIESASPGDWTEVAQGLGTASFVAWYVLEYHCPNALTLFDFTPLSGTSPRKRTWAVNANTIGGQLDEIARMASGANIGSASDGSLFFYRNPSMEEDTYRDAMETRMTIDVEAGHVEGEIEWGITYRPPVGQLKLSGFTVDSGTDETDAYVAAAYGLVQGQGANKSEEPSIVVATLQDLLNRVGHMLAIQNNATPEITVPLNRNMDVFDPARHYGTWVVLDIPAAYDPRGEGLLIRCSVVGVQRDWQEHDDAPATKRVSVTLVPETKGLPGVDITPVRGAGDNAYYDFEVDPPDDEWLNVAWAIDDQGAFAATANWTDVGATVRWRSLKAGITGTVTDCTFDWHSDLPRSGWRFGDLGAWCVAVSGTTIRVYYAQDILGRTADWQEVATGTMSDSTVVTSARIVMDKRTDGIIWVEWRTRNGCWYTRTSDGGQTWTSAARIGIASSDSANDDAPIGICIEGDYVIACGHTGVSKYFAYYAPSSGGSFTWTGSEHYADRPVAAIAPATDGVVYVTRDADTVATTTTYGVGAGSNTATLVSHTFTPFGSFLWSFGCGTGYTTVYGVDTSAATGNHTCSMVLLYALGEQEWHVSAYTVVFELQDWNYAMSSTSKGMDYTVEILDSSFAALHTHSDSFGYIRGSATVAYCEDTTDTQSGLDLDGARYIRITCESIFNKTASNQQAFGGVQSFSVSVDGDVINRKLYRVENYTSTSRVWNDITPAVDFIARRPYAIAPDAQSLGVSVLANDGSQTDLYSSDDGGETWTLVNDDVPYDGLLRGGDYLVAWGNNTIAASEDGGATFESKLGNWQAATGGLGRFLRVMAVL